MSGRLVTSIEAILTNGHAESDEQVDLGRGERARAEGDPALPGSGRLTTTMLLGVSW